MNNRTLKKKILNTLESESFENNLTSLLAIPGRKAVNPLFSFFCSGSEIVKWRAVTAMGLVVSNMVDEGEVESARVVMRRLMWSLNDESGGIGWGAPEAFGEITSRSRLLAEEFSNILVSYANPQGNYLEHEILQRGLLWGLGRLAGARPRLVAPAFAFLPPFLNSKDSVKRGLSVWIIGFLKDGSMLPYLEQMVSDQGQLILYREMKFEAVSVGRLAREALLKQAKQTS